MLHGVNKDEKHFWEKRKIALKKACKIQQNKERYKNALK